MHFFIYFEVIVVINTYKSLAHYVAFTLRSNYQNDQIQSICKNFSTGPYNRQLP